MATLSKYLEMKHAKKMEHEQRMALAAAVEQAERSEREQVPPFILDRERERERERERGRERN